MNKILKTHLDAGYYIKVEKVKQINGVKISFPEKNIDLNDIVESSWKIYESEKNVLTVYKNGSISKKIKCSEKFHRTIITLDFCLSCKKYDISSDNDLCVVYENNEITDQSFNLFKLLNIKQSKKEKDFSLVLKNIIDKKNPKELAKQLKLETELEYLEEILENEGY